MLTVCASREQAGRVERMVIDVLSVSAGSAAVIEKAERRNVPL